VSASGERKSCSPQLEIKLFGRFEVLRNGKPIPEEAWGRRKTKTLLKILLTDPGQVFTNDQLIEFLFEGENVQGALENLYGRISQLRRALEPELKRGVDSAFILRHGQTYCFNPDSSTQIDVVDFQQGLQSALESADAQEWIGAVEQFGDALALYRGEFLAEDRYEEWAEARRGELRDMHLRGLTRLADCYEHLGRLRQAISCCQRILGIEPYRESVIRQLMEYQHEVGQRAQALDTYNEGERALREFLDVEPSPETCALHQQISSGESKKEAKLDPRRIAVIPFVNVGSDPSNESLADGMTEELIYTLSKVAGLEVIAQTTVLNYKGAQKSVAEIGQELHVGSLLEGSVQKVTDRARILVQLINVKSEAHLWAEQYDREIQDILGVQGDIARRVAAALEVQLLAKEETAIRKGEASNPKARVAYLKGRLFLAKRTHDAYLKASEYFEQALAIEPDYARAFTGLADAYCLMVGFISASEGYEKAKVYTQQALALDPLCAEAHATLGLIAWLSEGDVHEAESKFLRAIELNPNYALAHERYAGLLMHTGRMKEACLRSENALTLDPLSATLNLTYAESLHGAGRLVEAVDQYEKALELNAALEDAWWGLWYSLAAQWDWDQAETITSRCVERYPNNPFAHVNVAQCVMCRGRLEEGLVEIRKALAVAGDPQPPYVLLHAGYSHYFGRQYDKAIGYLQQVLRVHPSWNSARITIAKCYIQQERYDEALEELDAAERMFGGADPFLNSHLHMDRGKIYATRGETEKAEAELEALMRGSGRQNRHLAISGLLFALGRTEEAMDWLEAAATAREQHIVILRKGPGFDQMRSHLRFQALLKRIGLTD
jgi:TolB-like protein/Flp pilus assembly protein TadD/DNA-binding winged helix-turn-helix (wHTH) protein